MRHFNSFTAYTRIPLLRKQHLCHIFASLGSRHIEPLAPFTAHLRTPLLRKQHLQLTCISHSFNVSTHIAGRWSHQLPSKRVRLVTIRVDLSLWVFCIQDTLFHYEWVYYHRATSHNTRTQPLTHHAQFPYGDSPPSSRLERLSLTSSGISRASFSQKCKQSKDGSSSIWCHFSCYETAWTHAVHSSSPSAAVAHRAKLLLDNETASLRHMFSSSRPAFALRHPCLASHPGISLRFSPQLLTA